MRETIVERVISDTLLAEASVDVAVASVTKAIVKLNMPDILLAVASVIDAIVISDILFAVASMTEEVIVKFVLD